MTIVTYCLWAFEHPRTSRTSPPGGGCRSSRSSLGSCATRCWSTRGDGGAPRGDRAGRPRAAGAGAAVGGHADARRVRRGRPHLGVRYPRTSCTRITTWSSRAPACSASPWPNAAARELGLARARGSSAVTTSAATPTAKSSRAPRHRGAPYGAHLFHTSNERVWEYVNRFTAFTGYRHRGLHHLQGPRLPDADQPRHDLRLYFGRAMGPDEARPLIAEQAAEVAPPPGQPGGEGDLTDRPPALRGVHPAATPPSSGRPTRRFPPPKIITRLPVRYTFDHRYFSDPVRGPAGGRLRGLAGAAWPTTPGSRYGSAPTSSTPRRGPGNVPVVYTGPLDRYFGHAEGELGWRTLDFEREIVATGDFQGTPVMNYADEDGAVHARARVPPLPSGARVPAATARSSSGSTPGSPPPATSRTTRSTPPGDRAKLRALPRAGPWCREGAVWFGGRLGTYRYLDMHMAIASALTMYENRLLADLHPAAPRHQQVTH